ncbi:MAG: FixH family protein [Anaerolineae bacterium]|nr:FixH family protein [Anaerolineae bacterium]
MRRFVLGAAVLAALFTLTACRQSVGGVPQSSAPGYVLVLSVEPTTPPVGIGTLSVSVFDPDGAPVLPAAIARIDAIGNMSHAGMTPVELAVSSGDLAMVSAGTYHLPFDFNMGGEWFIDVSVTLTGGGIVTGRIDLDVR